MRLIDKLCDQILNNDRLKEIDFANCRLSLRNLDMLLDALKDTQLEKLSLKGINVLSITDRELHDYQQDIEAEIPKGQSKNAGRIEQIQEVFEKMVELIRTVPL